MVIAHSRLAVCAVALLVLQGAAAAQELVPGEVIVKLRARADHASVRAAANALAQDHLADDARGELHRLRLRGPVDAALRALASHPDVIYAEPNYVFHLRSQPNDPSFSNLWALKNPGGTINSIIGTAGIDTNALAAWTFTTGSRAVVVAVVDSGVEYTHPDLAANIWSNPGGVGGCGAGTHGYNSVNGGCDPMDDATISHGTHIAGIIGAVGNNAAGVVGVNWAASIMGIKAFDSNGNTNTARLVSGVDFAVQAKLAGVNVRVVNCSWGGSTFAQALQDEFVKASNNGLTMVVAAPNNSSQNTDVTLDYPSSFHTVNGLVVTSIDANGTRFAAYGATSVDLAAPGENILSTVRGGGYDYRGGSSMAAGYVSGAAALILSVQPSWTAAQLKQAIDNGTTAEPSMAGLTVTGGRLDICKAIPSCFTGMVVQILNVVLQ